jgi:glyoxylase-like metal-dependent hydrolase (beta-lactamase superfamily II)
MSAEFRRWRIGEATITRIVEMDPFFMPPEGLFPAASAEMVRATTWLAPHFADAEGQINLVFQCFLVEVGARKILVDTCIGDGKQLDEPSFSNRVSDFLETLARAGAAPDSVDTVLCTHLHFDHIGWNTRLVDGAWIPTFPKARYLFGRTEVDHTLALTPDEGDASIAQSVRPILDAGLADLVEPTHRICDEVRLISTPGHTAGHVSVMIESAGERALISGDAFHHPAQLAHPDWSDRFAYDAALGIATRRRIFADLADVPTLLIGSHFCEPTAGLVLKDGDAWRLEPVWAERLEPAPAE